MIQRKEELKLNLTEDMAFSAKINNRIKPEIIAILQEVFELYHLGLFEDTYGNVPSDWSIVGIGRTKLTMLGIKYCEVLSLDEMPTEDINSVSNIFNLKQIKPSGIQPKQP